MTKRLGVGAAALPLALACASQSPPPTLPDTRPELVEVETYGPGRLFVRPDHQLGRYDDLFVRHVGFRYREGEERLRAREEDRIIEMLTAAIDRERNEAIGIASGPGPCVVSVDFFVRDLELLDHKRPAGSASEFRSSLGRATLILELRDSQSDRPLARFVERRSFGGGWWMGRTHEQLDHLGRAIGIALRDMGRQLRRVVPTSSATPDDSCRGSIEKVALGLR